MIIVRILGGLGNQMFQFAAGKALAEHHKTDLKIDISVFGNYKLRNFDLDRFNVSYKVAGDEEIKQFRATTSLQRVQARLTPYSRRKFYKQPYFHFDKKFFSLPGDIYLQGYFQSEKYFSSSFSTIRNEYYLKDFHLSDLSGVRREILDSNSVSLHIRRGDYQNPKILEIHGVLPIEYYLRAIRHLQQSLSHPKFYIFSDAPEKAFADLKLPGATIVSGKETNNHFEDLYLMSQCKHNIIANSSFSWWGAWLNNNPDKIVIGPKKWFNQGPKDTYDIMPESWIKM